MLLHYCTPVLRLGDDFDGKPCRKGLSFRAPMESNPAGNAEKPGVSKEKKPGSCPDDFTALLLHCFVSA